MKKTFFLLIFIIPFLNTTISAQSNFGIKLGGNHSNIIGDSEGVSSKQGFTGGIYWKKNLTSALGIHFDLGYSQQGAKANDGSTIKYDYLVFPMLLHFRASENMFIQTGFQAAALTSAKINKGGNSTDVKTSIQPLDALFVVGGGLDIGPNINFTVRYHYGLINTPNNPPLNKTFLNSFISGTVGYFFSKKKKAPEEEM